MPRLVQLTMRSQSCMSYMSDLKRLQSSSAYDIAVVFKQCRSMTVARSAE